MINLLNILIFNEINSDVVMSASKSSKEKSKNEKVREGDTSDVSYIHVRVPTYFKEDLEKKIDEEKTTITAYVINTLEREIYKSKEDDEVDEKEELIDTLLAAMENLERRIEIRLGTLQDTFNSLIGRLIDFDKNIKKEPYARKKGKDQDSDATDTLLDFDRDSILNVNPEEDIYSRVKRYIESKGREKLPDFEEIVAHLETDKKIKKYLEDQARSFPGWKESIIRDAIDEAIEELAIPGYRTSGGLE
jgi:hypothetical protein